MDYPPRKLVGRDIPKNILEIPEPPKQLYVRGTLPAPTVKTLAVVGSRALSRYGEEACRKLIAGLSGYPISIISGLALGADSCAHEAALQHGLHTTALPGSGIGDTAIAPRSNLPLATRILESGGALVSENDDSYVVGKYSFPTRNRLMAGLSDAVLLVEASAKSGTTITARLAMDYNRDLMCIPHRIGDANSEGTHYFLRQGATLVSTSEHIVEVLGLPVVHQHARTATLLFTDTEHEVLTHLKKPLTKDELLRYHSDDSADVLAALASLELRGVIREEFGTYKVL